MDLLSAASSPIKLQIDNGAEYAILGEERRDRGDVEESPILGSEKKYYLGWDRNIVTSESRNDGCCVKCCCLYSLSGVVYLSTVAILLRKEFFYSKVEGGEVPYSTTKLAEPVISTVIIFFVVLVLTLAILCRRWRRSA